MNRTGAWSGRRSGLLVTRKKTGVLWRSAATLLVLLAGWMPMASAGTLLVHDAVIITMAPGQQKPFTGYLLVGDDGRIASIGEGAAPADLKADRVVDADGSVVAPGFISAHSHIFMSPLRGLGHDVTLYGWFQAWDYYLRHASADDMYWFTLHGAIDFLRNGITTAYDFTDDGVVQTMSTDPAKAHEPGVLKPGPVDRNQFQAKLDAGLRFINSVWIADVGSEPEMKQRFRDLLTWSEQHEDNPLFLKMAISGSQQFAPTPRTAEREVAYMREFEAQHA